MRVSARVKVPPLVRIEIFPEVDWILPFITRPAAVSAISIPLAAVTAPSIAMVFDTPPSSRSMLPPAEAEKVATLVIALVWVMLPLPPAIKVRFAPPVLIPVIPAKVPITKPLASV